MNKNTLEGKWHQLQGTMRQKWGRLTDDDVAFIFGSWERAVGKLQERYGWEKERAEKEMESWTAMA